MLNIHIGLDNVSFKSTGGEKSKSCATFPAIVKSYIFCNLVKVDCTPMPLKFVAD